MQNFRNVGDEGPLKRVVGQPARNIRDPFPKVKFANEVNMMKNLLGVDKSRLRSFCIQVTKVEEAVRSC